jgi:hypothetical protein
MRASYRVAHLLAEGSEAFSDEKFVRKSLKHKVQDTCSEK